MTRQVTSNKSKWYFIKWITHWIFNDFQNVPLIAIKWESNKKVMCHWFVFFGHLTTTLLKSWKNNPPSIHPPTHMPTIANILLINTEMKWKLHCHCWSILFRPYWIKTKEPLPQWLNEIAIFNFSWIPSIKFNINKTKFLLFSLYNLLYCSVSI